MAGRVAAQEKFELGTAVELHSEPDGAVVGALPAGAPIAPGPSRGEWRQIAVEGWVASRAVGPTERGGFDLVVTDRSGEELRGAPNGKVLGRLRYGALLTKVEGRGDWTRVRRSGWMRSGMVVRAGAQQGAGDGRRGPGGRADDKHTVARSAARPAAPAAAGDAAGSSAAAAPSTSTTSQGALGPQQRGQGPQQGTQGAQALQGAAAANAPVENLVAGRTDVEPARNGAADRIEAARETGVFAAPGAEDALVGTLRGGASGRVLGRAGGWARVQVEGWVREADLQPASGAALRGVTAAEVRGAPERYVGQTVDWRLQLIAVQSADELRSEMAPGQPYLLTRGPLPEPGFVYVTITPQQADSFRALPPLQELVLRGRIRAARSRFLETPVLELVSVVSGAKTP